MLNIHANSIRSPASGFDIAKSIRGRASRKYGNAVINQAASCIVESGDSVASGRTYSGGWSSSKFQDTVVQQFKIVLLAAFVHSSQDVQQLSANRRIAGEWDASELSRQVLCRSMRGKIQQVVSELAIGVVVDTDMSVPFDAGTAGWRHA